MRKITLAFILVASSLVVPLTAGAGEGTGAIYGTVTDAVTGAPIDDVCVTVTQGGNPTEYSGWTDSNGVYEVGAMAPGAYDLAFAACEQGGYDSVGAAATVVVGPAVKVDAELSLSAGYGALVGTVTNADSSEPIRELCVKLYQSNDDILVATAWTREDGGYQLRAMAGDYRLRFTPCDGNGFEEQWFDGAAGWSDSDVVPIQDGVYSEGVDAALVPKPEDAVVWGYVVDGDTGEGVNGYCVSIYSGDDKVKTVLTGDLGGWETAIAAGEYRFKTWACEGHADLGTVWYLDAEEIGGARVVGLESGALVELDRLIVGDNRFRDSIDSMFLDDIVWLADNGITLGCNTEGTAFCPDRLLTRAQMAAFLRRALSDILVPGEPVTFTDLDTTVFADDIEWLASVGVTLGCDSSGSKFCPHDEVTRGQMAAFLHRALKDVLVGGEVDGFDDDDGSVFEEDIDWLASVGVTNGCDSEGTQFCPSDPVLRAHMAAFLRRALDES